MKGVLKGLGVTLSTALRRPVTVQYPEKKHGLPVRARSFPVLLWDFDHDEPYCTGCMLCVRNCPVECMTAVMRDNPNYALGLSNRRKGIEKFWIDYGRCMRCNICVEVCNFEAIAMDNTWSGHDHSTYDRRDLHQDLDDLTRSSREGRLPNPYNPADDMAATVARLQDKEIPSPSSKGARPEARQAQLERIARGEPAGIREREPDPAVVKAPVVAAAAGADDEAAGLSEKKIRAKRMRAEKEAREKAIAEGTDPEAAVAAVRAEFDATAAAPPPAPAPAAAVGAKGEANSPAKLRARRMRAEKEAREKAVAEGRDPDAAAAEAAAAFDASLGGGTPSVAAAAPTPVAAPPAPVAAPAAAIEGDPNSNKMRARRMREEKEARDKAVAEGSDPDAAVAEVRRKWGVQ